MGHGIAVWALNDADTVILKRTDKEYFEYLKNQVAQGSSITVITNHGVTLFVPHHAIAGIAYKEDSGPQ